MVLIDDVLLVVDSLVMNMLDGLANSIYIYRKAISLGAELKK